MGQLFSDITKDEGLGDLESSFTAYFKKIKRENTIISQETARLIEFHLKKGNILGANSVISDELKNIDSATINVAVTGESGGGKSSFINALRGLRPEDKGAAEVGVVETTMKITSYKHPKIKTLTLWDLPGIGTMKFPPKDYLEKVEFQKYDFFIIVSATRFTKLELDLSKAIRFMKKNYYFVRTKVDMDIDNEKKTKPRTFNRKRILENIRSYCVDTFRENNIDSPQIFLISSYSLSDYDFPVLMDTLIKELPTQKRHSFRLSMSNITEAAIDGKHESMQQTIWLEAFKTGLLANAPAVGILKDDMKHLKASLNRYRVLFGVDDESLGYMAKDSKVSVEQLKKIIKSPCLLETKKEETFGETFLKYLEKFASVNGGVLATGLYFRKTFYFHHIFLDTVAEDAKILLRKTYSKN
ncbi:interferon-inducible GTPase 1 [Cricetulus griseus]|uniref:Interferon-inducible GTPase 1 n=1 Tax=Cricetulus griseus TaxID=10029 RepID=G3IAC3_CRIGR|nr:interferon-inducible GTPase 1 [Cricetulus griseus]XP_035296028.1 interferon-inducible GTPase 1 [Cricetulus griseus]EGV95179.1 Interferon-inducible GTPase 1 [Cricetulus griseus]